MELAKLALVTSKDEDDDIEQTATDSSNDTDATLVEDAPPRAGAGTSSPVGSPGVSSSSVLGKRSRDKESGSRMSIDSITDKDNYVIISTSLDAGPSGLGDAGKVDMKDAEAPAPSSPKPPPLPPRKTSESVMMFGALGFLPNLRLHAHQLSLYRTTARRLGMYGQLRLPDRDRLVKV
jgi:ubiquitin carboxyl-terminal hydrolase 25